MQDHALAITDLCVGYGRRPVLQSLSVDGIRQGEITALIGPNGAGKTTLLRAIARLLPTKGNIVFNGRDLLGMGHRDHANLVSYMPQALPQRISLSVVEAVITAINAMPSPEPFSQAQARDKAMTMLARLGLDQLAFAMLDELSGGQRQLASLAQAVVRNPAILLLDEPTSALDPHHQVGVMKAVRDLVVENNITAIVVMHDLNLSLRWADRIVLLDRGAVIATGAPHEVVTSQTLAQTYRIDARVERCSRGLLHVMVDDVLAPSRSAMG